MEAYLAHPHTRGRRRFTRALVGLALALGIVVGASPPSMAATPTQAQRVVRAVSSHIGARYVLGATGPSTFDCSGLVFRAFREARLARRIGGEDTALGYYQRFRRLGRVSRLAPRVGDLVVYANGGHIGIYVGRGQVVSALLSGVKRHPMRGLDVPFTGILRVQLIRQRARPHVQRRVVVAQRRLPVRANPGTESRSLGVIRRGARVTVRGTRTRWGTTWIRVRLDDGRYGWVKEAMTSPR